MDRTETVCPQLLEQLEDELLTVSTARLLLEKMNFLFRISDKRRGGEAPIEKRTSIGVYAADIYDWLQHSGCKSEEK